MNAQQRTTSIRDVTTKQTSRGDLFQVATTDGKEYATFNAGLGHQARQLIGRTVALRYTEKFVEKNGQSYTNLYYEGAEPTQETLDFDQPTFAVSPAGTTNVPEGIRETRIMRQAATKVAAQMLSYLPINEQTPTGLLGIAEFLMRYYETGYDGALGATAPGPDPSKPPLGDEDIPF